MTTNNAINSSYPLAISDGGTAATSFTAYSVICSGTTSTGALQNVSGVGSATNVLTSNGASALPTWQNAPGGSGVILKSSTTTITSAQVKALHATPITVLSTPGALTVNYLLGFQAEMVYGGTNAFTAAASQSIELRYVNGSGFTIQTGVFDSTTIASTTSVISHFPLSVIGPTAAQVENQVIVAYNPVVTEIGGNAANNNTVKFTFWYIPLAI